MQPVQLAEHVTMGLPVRRGFLIISIFLLVYASPGVWGQEDDLPKRPSSINGLYNTTSCLEPPYTCPHRRIQFYLYTRATQENPLLLDTRNPSSLYNSRFNAAHPTKIVIHGFGGGRNLVPSTDIRKAYFTRGEFNILIVDYGSLVKEPCLSQIEWGPRFCAQCIAQLITYLAANPRGTQPKNLHLLGYSVGAHIAGLVANYLPTTKVGRITGLDPTIIFYMGQNRSRDLDASDAHFVDVIHTGAGVLGQWGPSGHVDFYVNGGSSQPGCQHSTLLKTLSCDHTKVTPYFIESINSKSGFWSAPCPNQFMFFLGLCAVKEDEYILMGEDVPLSARGLYYLSTNAKKPYAKGIPQQTSELQQRRNTRGNRPATSPTPSSRNLRTNLVRNNLRNTTRSNVRSQRSRPPRTSTTKQPRPFL